LRNLATQSFKQLGGDPIHYFIDDALRDDQPLLRFIRKRACRRLRLDAVYKHVRAPDLPHDLYGCMIGEYVIQFQYVVHIWVLYNFDFTRRACDRERIRMAPIARRWIDLRYGSIFSPIFNAVL